MRTRAFAERRMFRRIDAADEAGSRDENAAAYRPPASARTRRTPWAMVLHAWEASPAEARRAAAPAAACTTRFSGPACAPTAQSRGAKQGPVSPAARPVRVRQSRLRQSRSDFGAARRTILAEVVAHALLRAVFTHANTLNKHLAF